MTLLPGKSVSAMKDLLIQTAKRTGLVDADQLARFLEENKGHGRLDEVLLTCPYFTEDVVLQAVRRGPRAGSTCRRSRTGRCPPEFIQNVPATYAQHHYLIGIKPPEQDGGRADGRAVQAAGHQRPGQRLEDDRSCRSGRRSRRGRPSRR